MAESTVLVVDDEPLILEFLAENLRRRRLHRAHRVQRR
jgi:DNA-binding response OmpR family regulator